MTGGYYRYCGLTIESALDLPELRVVPPSDADIRIRRAPVPASLSDAVDRTDIFEHNGRDILWRLDGVARYRISQGGRLIEVDEYPGVDQASLRLFLMAPVFALSAMLRGDWLLNASAVARDGLVSAFIGAPGSGKSTTAALLVQQGWQLVSDSLLRISFDPQGRPLAHPQAPWQWLWPDTAEHPFGEPLRPGIDLRRIESPCINGLLPLTRIAVLHHRLDEGPAECRPRRGQDALALLLNHVAGGPLLGALGSRASLFLWGTRLAACIDLQHLDIPWGRQRLDALRARLSAWGGCQGKTP